MTTTHHLRTLTHGLHALAVLLLAALWLAACSRPKAEVPAHSRPVSEAPHTFPDYRDVVIPPNIAPLNMQVKNAGTAFVAHISAGSHFITAAAGADGVLQFDSLQWRTLLTQTRGHDLRVSLYAQREGEWVSLPAYTMHVAEEEIDRYLSYRLIEPSYEIYRQLGLYQRDLEGFGVRTIYENNRRYESDHNHCINCHNYQNHSTRRMLFHVRGKHGGTVFVENGKAVKMNMKSDSLLASAVYPTWHPQHNWVVFSSNQTGQAFHLRNPQKIEVIDYGSDLIFYDAERHTVCNVLKTDADLETFPCWAPDGRKLYYCSAHVSQFEGLNTDQRRDLVTNLYTQLHYNVMSMTFDPATRTWGAPQVEVDCAAMGRSAAVPRVSPDGRYVLFTMADYGQFHIWHLSADLYVKDLQTGQVEPLAAANSPRQESYHAWSSNGRWIVVASRRDDASYSRAYIAYFDKQGKSHKAFLMPQHDPRQNVWLTKSYNVPELTRDAVPVSPDDLKACIYADDKAQPVRYGK